jgi:hypothetical protein
MIVSGLYIQKTYQRVSVKHAKEVKKINEGIKLKNNETYFINYFPSLLIILLTA